MQKSDKPGLDSIRYPCDYPVELEHQLRKHLLAGESASAYVATVKLLHEVTEVTGGEAELMKSWLTQACVVLYHKAWQVGVPLPLILEELRFVIGKLGNKRERNVVIGRVVTASVSFILQAVKVQINNERMAVTIRNYVQAHFHKGLTINEVAEAVHLSLPELRKILYFESGLNFNGYVLQVKLAEAKKMLCGTEFSVADIAGQLGFRDTGYFIRVFKRHEGVTPGQFARKQRIASGVVTFGSNTGSDTADKDGKGLIQRERDVWISMLGGDVQNATQQCSQLLADVYSEVDNLEQIKVYVLKLVIVFSRKAVQIGIMAGDYLNNMLVICEQVMAIGSYHQLTIFLNEFVNQLHNRVKHYYQEEAFRVVEAIKNYVRHNFSCPIRLDDLAHLVNFSPYHLARLFSKLTGQTLCNYITGVRIDEAKKYICTSDCTLEEIAERVGYQDASHFMTVFKKKVGCTPRQYAGRLNETSFRGGFILH